MEKLRYWQAEEGMPRVHQRKFKMLSLKEEQKKNNKKSEYSKDCLQKYIERLRTISDSAHQKLQFVIQRKSMGNYILH